MSLGAIEKLKVSPKIKSVCVTEDRHIAIKWSKVPLAEKYADKKKISKLIVRPRYDLYGKAAPIKRNETMVELADTVLIIWDGKSKGTNSTINFSKKLNKELILIKQDN